MYTILDFVVRRVPNVKRDEQKIIIINAMNRFIVLTSAV